MQTEAVPRDADFEPERASASRHPSLLSRMEQVYRQLSDAQQLIRCIEGEPGTSHCHAMLRELDALLAESRRTLSLPTDP